MELFERLNSIDVSEKIEKKNNLSYLSWSFAWGEFKKACPDATYKIMKNENNMPLFGSKETGFMVYTQVTAGGETHEMWLAIMDYRNKSILQPMTTDINKAVMRCLTKNLAMFGLGLYIYAGEDLPEQEKSPKETDTEKKDITQKTEPHKATKEEEEETKVLGELQGEAMKLFNQIINKRVMKITECKAFCTEKMGVDKPIFCEDEAKLKAYIQAAQDLLR